MALTSMAFDQNGMVHVVFGINRANADGAVAIGSHLLMVWDTGTKTDLLSPTQWML